MKPNEKMDQLVETKLTKTEAIDLVVEEMKDEVNKRRLEVDAEIKRLRKDITLQELAPLFGGCTFNVEVPSTYTEGYSVSFNTGRLGIGRFPKELQTKLSRIAALSKEQEELGKRINELNESKGKIRNAILKTMLEGTDQGRQFLQLLGDLKLRVSPKLTEARKLLGARYL